MSMAEHLPLVQRIIGRVEKAVTGVEATFPSQVSTGRPLDDVHKKAVETIWAIGKTDFDVVRVRIEEQFPKLNPEEVEGMVSSVRAIRAKSAR